MLKTGSAVPDTAVYTVYTGLATVIQSTPNVPELCSDPQNRWARVPPMVLSAAAYPRLAAYLDSLPEGLQSHPQCTCVAEVFSEVLQAHPNLGHHAGIPAPLAALLLTPPKPTQDIPEVLSTASRMLLRDVAYNHDVAYLQFMEALSAKVFAKPMYRMLMYVMSPSLILMGAQRRWARFRKGTTLRAEPRSTDGTVELVLSFPHRLFPPLALETFGGAYCAALKASRARNVNVLLRDHDNTRGVFVLSWE